ncbi:MAG TPA: hypothetical protein VMW45_01005 [Dehalococcoidia bacterium]|nr:hypothetical protein [Dehalococcoidia bacterium]
MRVKLLQRIKGRAFEYLSPGEAMEELPTNDTENLALLNTFAVVAEIREISYNYVKLGCG